MEIDKNWDSQIDYLILQGQIEEAEEACIQLLNKGENAAAYYKLGKIYMIIGRETESKIFYEKALKIDPNFLEAKQDIDTLKILTDRMQKGLQKNPNVPDKNKVNYQTNLNSITNRANTVNTPNKLIPPEIKNDELYQFIIDLSSKANIKHVLEIGSSSGDGSTEAFVLGMRSNKTKPNLYCMEIDSDRFKKLKDTYNTDPFVKCYNVSSVSENKLLSEKDVRHFYNYKKTNLNQYSIDLVLSWLDQDRANIRKADKRDNGIQLIKKENNIEKFDVVLIDGSAFTGEAELNEIYGAEIIILDDINDIKNFNNYHRLQIDPAYTLIKENSKLRNGYAVFIKVENWNDVPKNIESYTREEFKQTENLQKEFQFNSEQSEQKLVKKLIKKGMCVFDVGANIGDYTKLFSVLTGDNGKVFAFEPSLQTYNILKGEINKYKLKNVFLENTAAYFEDTEIVFNEFEQEYSAWNSIGQPVMEDPKDHTKIVPIVNSRRVKAVALDSFCRERSIEKIDYLKLDVEGAEIFALKGAVELLKKKKIGLLQFEISQKMLEGLKTKAIDVFVLLNSLGYECHKITEEGKIGEKVLNSSSFYENYIAFPVGIQNEGKTKNEDLPVHFFTIVLNGKPFIDYHINVFKKLPFKWHWHIVEGVADLKNDTAWSLQNGGHIDNSLHNNGLSKDGTTEYLDSLKYLYPDNITIYRKEDGNFWNGKLEMVNAPLVNINEEALLWQVDSDELWKAEQIIEVRNLFMSDKDRTAAFFYCRYFVGENLYITTINTYGNHVDYEWLRVWNYQPGDKWMSHEPPTLSREIAPDVWLDLSKVNPFTHEETLRQKLVFQHYAYVTEAQLRFKEIYYGYKNALSKWKSLNMNEYYPVCLKDFFDWVEDGSIVETIYDKDRIAKKENGEWNFNYNGNGIRTDNIFKSDSDYVLDAEAEINNNNLIAARRLLTCALNISSRNIDAKNDLAVIEIIDKHYEKASKILNEIIESDNKNETALKNKLVLENILIKNRIILNNEKLTRESGNEGKKSEKKYGFQINFDLNNGCNLDCIMCGNIPNKKYKDQYVMDKTTFHERFVKVFNHASVFQFGCFFEPLMVPYFEEAVWAIKSELKPGVKGTIISNGMMMTQSRIEALVDSDIFSKIRFSIDSVSEELFEKIRSGAKLKKLLDHIQKVAEYKNSQNSKSQIEVNFTIMRENVHELPQLVLLAKEYGIDSITTHKLTPDDVAYVDNDYYNILTENISHAAQLANENGISFSGQTYYTKDTYLATINNKIKRECGYYKRNYFLVTIDCYGNITHPCKLTNAKLGNLMQNSFEEILQLEPYKKLLASVENPNADICTTCGMYV